MSRDVGIFRLGNIVLKIVVGDITEFAGDAIVNPANTYGYMGGGVALAIKMRGGRAIEEEAIGQAPIPIGSAIITTGGALKVKAVIHTPTVVEPGGSSSPENVYRAARAAIKKAIENNFKTIAFPLMGAGIGGVSPKESAKAMVKAFEEFRDREVEVYLYIRDPDIVAVVAEACSK
ncbi:Appr-1-p processing domain protein [Ignisphaera aggregans DSM 17230]|uniref:Appr-1-p processing domain protein n=1 Tax=Ignisphaera aggregans (strain DSM 17230 / JCM 13409 / AQ1.S1) TaxID=583356 RepID=E0SS39_IGNAA|nr:Appr-1-p processing domain protein [Ignisphaera aggregans DSM 17230]